MILFEKISFYTNLRYIKICSSWQWNLHYSWDLVIPKIFSQTHKKYQFSDDQYPIGSQTWAHHDSSPDEALTPPQVWQLPGPHFLFVLEQFTHSFQSPGHDWSAKSLCNVQLVFKFLHFKLFLKKDKKKEIKLPLWVVSASCCLEEQIISAPKQVKRLQNTDESQTWKKGFKLPSADKKHYKYKQHKNNETILLIWCQTIGAGRHMSVRCSIQGWLH